MNGIMNEQALWLSERDVTSLVSLDDAIIALEAGVRALGSGQGQNVPKALGSFGDACAMHSLGSALPAAGFCGFKNWVHTKSGARALFLLFNTQGSLVAIMEAGALGQLRTAAMTGLGTKWLAPERAEDMAIIGSGRQSITQVAAVNTVRPLKRIRVWSPTPAKRGAFAAEIRNRFDAEVLEADTLEQALEGAPVVTLVTRAQEPFVSAAMLAKGAHVNAVGAILPANAEFHQDVFARAGSIAVDDLANTQKASREFIEHFDARGWQPVQTLGDVIANGVKRSGPGDLTLFKAMGMGISDLSVAILAYQRAGAAGLGRQIDLSEGASAPIRWASSQPA
jgi:ornithine cyclodeaminase/alanine dehydrogenase-like protein (mu-crystallin family)